MRRALGDAELAAEARIHPQTIVNGWRLAHRDLAPASSTHGQRQRRARSELMQIAMTTLSSKLVYHEKEYFAALAVDAVLRLKGSGNLDHIHVLKKPGGSMRDSYLADGFIIDKRLGVGQPRRIENAKVAARQHVDGRGQDQGLRLARARRLAEQGRRDVREPELPYEMRFYEVNIIADVPVVVHRSSSSTTSPRRSDAAAAS